MMGRWIEVRGQQYQDPFSFSKQGPDVLTLFPSLRTDTFSARDLFLAYAAFSSHGT
jgi:hypothetical protein